MKQRHSNFGVIYGIVDSVTLQSMFEIKSKGWKLKTIKIAISIATSQTRTFIYIEQCE